MIRYAGRSPAAQAQTVSSLPTFSVRSIRTRRRFDNEALAALHQRKIIRIKAGAGPRRFIGIWVVVVERRVFVRSWSIKARGWYRAFLEDPHGFVQIGPRTFPVRAVRIRSKQLLSAVDRGYLDKYNTPGSLRYARDLGSTKSRGTTTELVPAARTPPRGGSQRTSR